MNAAPPREEPPQHRRSLNRAAVITSVATPFALTVLLPVIGFLSGSPYLFDDMIPIIAMAVFFGVPLCFGGMALFLPLVRLMHARRRLHAPMVCLVAVALGVLLFCIPMAFDPRFDAELLVYGSVMGLVAAVIFSWAAGISWRRQRL